jgi:uncharacterized delta-60 repeat protein
VAGGQTGREFALARYTPSGALDPTFGSSGIVITPQADVLNGLAIQADGKIIAVGGPDGGSPMASVLARYNQDGTLDATFGSGGIVSRSFGQGDTAVALQSDGKIVTTAVNNGNFGVARYLAAGPLIGSFTANSNAVASGSNVTLTASNITDGNFSSTRTITQVAFYYDDSSGTQ